jgi:hypothetical protein
MEKKIAVSTLCACSHRDRLMSFLHNFMQGSDPFQKPDPDPKIVSTKNPKPGPDPKVVSTTN